MKNGLKKELLFILVLTLIFGIASFFIAKEVDRNVSEVTKIRYQIEELTRVAVDKENRIDEVQSVEYYLKFFNEELPGINEIIDMLNQIEDIGRLTNLKLTMKLEEGIVGSSDIEFVDEKEKNDFLKRLVLKEFTPEENNQSQNTGAASSNVVLQIMKEAEESEAVGNIKISYLDIDLSVDGTYDNIRMYIDLLQSSKYYFNISEIRLSKAEEGGLKGTIRVRAFIFEKGK
jgi:hypothetical protein